MTEVAPRRVRTLSDVLRNASDCSGEATCGRPAAVWPLADLRDHRDGSGAGPWCSGPRRRRPGWRPTSSPGWSASYDVQTVIAAALKLQPFDPSRAVAWAVRAEAEVERLVGDTAGLTGIEQIPAHGAPLVEEWGQRHELATRRLFRA